MPVALGDHLGISMLTKLLGTRDVLNHMCLMGSCHGSRSHLYNDSCICSGQSAIFLPLVSRFTNRLLVKYQKTDLLVRFYPDY